ncbi:hypothetical protein BGZ94_009417 [Podila epigama]|nr:hypothetical protein BGZ94_009417 [Podila epigama]
MALPHSILSTHSGHHRIFIGPVVQKANTTNNHGDHDLTAPPSPVTPSASRTHLSQQNNDNNNNNQQESHQHPQKQHRKTSTPAPKPWWEGSSFLRSRLSLSHLPTPPPSGSSSGSHPPPTALSQSATGQQSQVVSEDEDEDEDEDEGHGFSSDSDDGFEDEGDFYDSEDERGDYEHSGRDKHKESENDDDLDLRHGHYSAQSSESHKGASMVGHSYDVSEESGRMQSRLQQHGLDSHYPVQENHELRALASYHTNTNTSANANTHSSSNENTSKSTRRRARRRTKSMRDEGEPNRLKKLLGHLGESRHHQGRLDNPDLDWATQGGSRLVGGKNTRQMTSGALTMGHPHHPSQQQEQEHGQGHGQEHGHQPTIHHTVLVSSPMSSEIDLPGTNRPTFVSSPASSILDIDPSDERPAPFPIQKSGEGLLSPNDHTSSLSSTFSPMRSNVQRGATWVTAKEYPSSLGQASLYDQAIKEESEPEEEEGRIHENAEEIDQDVVANGANQHTGAGVGSSRPTSDDTSSTRQIEGLGILDEPKTSTPLTDSLSKASSRFGRALLKREPTGLKPQTSSSHETSARKAKEPTQCSMEKECQTATGSVQDKKRVRFLTKVQSQIGSSRQPTQLSTHPVIKQDRMLIRKEVTQRPGPHVFNSDTARRFERQSEGWKEWWCVMKGCPMETKPNVTKVHKKSRKKQGVEKGRIEFYYNHKKIKGTLVLSSYSSVSVYSSLDYSIAITQNYPDAVGLTVYIIRPRTISLACAWYMDIYTLLNGDAPIPSFIDIAVPDFDVKIRVPIPEDSDSETESSGTDEESDDDEQNDTGLSDSLPRSASTVAYRQETSEQQAQSNDVIDSFKTARTSLHGRMVTKTFYLTNDHAKPTLVAPDEVTPKLLRSHVLALLKDVPDWTEVVKLWQDPRQFGDVALCWKRYDRIEWIYWTERVWAETDNLHLRKDHIGFADGSEWTGNMDQVVVGPQVLDKTHRLELRPITHYPTKAKTPDGQELHEPDPIEGYLVRVSTFSGNPIRRFRRLYVTSHDHMLFYTVPSESHSPSMQHAGSIDPSALLFCISPHRSANPDHKDMAQSRSVRRLKAQVRAARGFIDMTQIESVRVLTEHEWNVSRHTSAKQDKANKMSSRLKKLKQKAKDAAADVRRADHVSSSAQAQEQPTVVVGEADNYFFPEIQTEPVVKESVLRQPETSGAGVQAEHGMESTLDYQNRESSGEQYETIRPGDSTLTEGIVRSATMMADLLLHNDNGAVEEHTESEPSNVFEIEMKDGTCVRFRAYNAEAAKLWRDQVERLAQYWRLRKHLDVKAHMKVSQANCQLASSLDDDEIQVGEVIQDWDNERAMVDTSIWNWCVVNGCRSITKSGVLYYKPRLHSTFRKMYLVLTEGFLMLFHPHRRSKTTGELVPTTSCKLYGIHSLMDIYVYSGHFSDGDTAHGTNDESERLPRFFPDGLIVDDPDEDCTFSIWRGKRRKMFSRRGVAMTSMSSRSMTGSSRVFGQDGLLSSIVKDGVVYGSKPQSCVVLRARSRADLEEWVHALNTEIERCVRAERRRIRTTGHA